jgi:signal peptidase II
VYNPGAAFGIHVGGYSRIVFTVLAVVALVVLGTMVRHTRPGQSLRLVALALVCGGAVGNLIDRVRSGRGVGTSSMSGSGRSTGPPSTSPTWP